MLRGSIGTTQGYTATDTVHTPKDGIIRIPTYHPHTFWPDPACTEDATILLWSHPHVDDNELDATFFSTILQHSSDVFEKKTDFQGLDMLILQ